MIQIEEKFLNNKIYCFCFDLVLLHYLGWCSSMKIQASFCKNARNRIAKLCFNETFEYAVSIYVIIRKGNERLPAPLQSWLPEREMSLIRILLQMIFSSNLQLPISDEIVVLVTWTTAPSRVTSWSFPNVYQSPSISRGTTF